MRYVRLFAIKLKSTLSYRRNLLMLIALPALAAIGAWALLAFYLEGGANIPVGVLDYDKTEFSRTATTRFTQNSTVGVRELRAGDIDFYESAEAARQADMAEAGRLIQTGSLDAAIVILEGFSDAILRGEPENIFTIVSSSDGITRGLAAELFAAQVSRLYFNCDSANRVTRDAVAAARSARKPLPTEEERQAIFDEAFAYCDSYWEPQPLMTVEYEKLQAFDATSAFDATNATKSPVFASAYPGADRLAGASGGWDDMRDMLNGLIARAVLVLFFVYAVFCVLNATGVMIDERADGVLTRMRAGGFGAGAWIGVSAAAPFVLYGIPCAALTAFLSPQSAGNASVALNANVALSMFFTSSVFFTLFAILCVSLLGACAAYIFKKHGGYRLFTLVCAILSAGVSLFFI